MPPPLFPVGGVAPFLASEDDDDDEAGGAKSYPRMNGASSGILTDSQRTAVSKEEGRS